MTDLERKIDDISAQIIQNFIKIKNSKDKEEIRKLYVLNIVHITKIIKIQLEFHTETAIIKKNKEIKERWIEAQHNLVIKLQKRDFQNVNTSILEEIRANRKYLKDNFKPSNDKNKKNLHYIPNELMEILKPFLNVWDKEF